MNSAEFVRPPVSPFNNNQYRPVWSKEEAVVAVVGSLVVVEAGHNRVLDQQNRTDLYVPRRTEKA